MNEQVHGPKVQTYLWKTVEWQHDPTSDFVKGHVHDQLLEEEDQ